MTPQQVLAVCLAKRGAYQDFPFGPEVVIVKVRGTAQPSGRIFAQLFTRGGQDYVTLNCEKMTGQFYRGLFPGVVVRGYHCPPVQQPYFNTLPLNGEVPDETLLEMIAHSYHTVVEKLPKQAREELKRAASPDEI